MSDILASDAFKGMTLDDFTPAMRQFLELKQRYPETLVLFRMGDFYETFFSDAVKANRLIGITLTKRGKMKNGEPIPMAGIPMVSLDQYIARLVRLGESIVIAEQIGTPGQGLMERRVSRIITPGTLTETTLLPEKSNAVLLSVAKPRTKDAPWGLAWLTLSNGAFAACEAADETALATEMARLSPTEVLVTEKLKTRMREDYPEYTVTPLPHWHFDAAHGAEQIKKTFNLANLDAWGIADKPAILAAVNALLDYTRETQVDMLPFIEPLTLINEADHVVIDPASRRNLEISDSLRSEGRGPTLFSVLDGCRTGMGSRTLLNWLHQPLRDKAKAEARHEAIASLVADADWLAFLREHLKGLPDMERIAGRIALGSVRPKELAALRDGLPALALLQQEAAARVEPWFDARSRALVLPPELSAALTAAVAEDPATFLRDGNVIRAGFNAELDELRALRDNTGQYLIDMEAREREATGLTTLRVDYNRVHGFFIEVSKAQAKDVPDTYQRRQTLKNTERFITPELKRYEDRALSAKERALALEKELYEALVNTLSPYVNAMMAAAHAVAAVDVVAALAQHAADYHWVRPTLVAQPGIDIRAGRHPVVETALETFVPNDCRLGDGRRCLIITGPNMGGKSTYMRSVALIALLAWAGAFVPADAVTIGPIDRIHTRIGASDDLARGRSTFMVEMTEAAAILHQATDRSLVLMDEIGRGTSTFDGLSLAGAIAQELVEKTRALTLFATHYFELTQLAGRLKEMANVHVSATQSKNRIIFLHEISEGPANRSYGIAVAQLAGVPMSVVRRARAMLEKLEERDRTAATPQASLFAGDTLIAPAAEPAAESDENENARWVDFADSLADMDLDALTPREALARLYDIQDQARGLRLND